MAAAGSGLRRVSASERGVSVALDGPDLHLSGGRLRSALQACLDGCEALGGVERYIHALRLKSEMFQEILLERGVAAMERDDFAALCAFMATVRRRVAPDLEGEGFTQMRLSLQALISNLDEPATVDQRIEQFCLAFPQDRGHRWVRDLAAEVLHNLDPERYPLMARWVWDRAANTGALREIWFAENVDHLTLEIEDHYPTFLMLRRALAGFLSASGFFRDMPCYVDLLLAQVYAGHICAQGGSYLRADFSSPEDPMQHTRRMLGLDGVKAGSSRLRMKSIDGAALVLADEQEG